MENLISKGRLYDTEVLSSVLISLDVATKLFTKTGNHKYKEDISYFTVEVDRLRTRILNYEYKVEDELYRAADARYPQDSLDSDETDGV